MRRVKEGSKEGEHVWCTFCMFKPVEITKRRRHIWQSVDNQEIQGAQQIKLSKINESIKKWANELNRTFSREEVQMAKKHI
jgi:hypothetical protein